MAVATYPPWPVFDLDDEQAALNVLRSGKVNYWGGEEGQNFEREFASFVGTKYAVAVSSGTAALEGALRACGISAGDEVIVPCRTFIASVTAILQCGAIPVFCDSANEMQTLSVATIEPLVTEKTKAIIAVHLGGWPCDMPEITAFAASKNLLVIEDACQAHGASVAGRCVGGWGDIAAFSFCQDKLITSAGEGGMITTNREDLWKRAWSYKDHGKDWDQVHRVNHPPGFRWLHSAVGTNARLSEIQSAVGRSQLRKAENWRRIRRDNAEQMRSLLLAHEVFDCPAPGPHLDVTYYKLYAFVKPQALRSGWNRDTLREALNHAGLPTFSGSCSEVYLENTFDHRFRPPSRLPNAQRIGERSLMFLVHPGIGPTEFETAERALAKVLGAAPRPKPRRSVSPSMNSENFL